MNKYRFLELLQDEINGKLSSNRFISILFALTAIGISIFLAINGVIISEYNILVGSLIAGAIGNKFVGSIKKGSMEQNINIEKQ